MLPKQGLDVVRHHDPIDQHDLNLLNLSGVIGTNKPQSLQRLGRLIWLNVTGAIQADDISDLQCTPKITSLVFVNKKSKLKIHLHKKKQAI